jgi:hypothetical protein
MIRIEMASEDAEMLAVVLERALSDVRYEIANVDSLDFREKLKRRKAFLEDVLDQLTVTH